MFIRKSFAVFLAVQSEAAPAEAPRDCVLDWRWFEDEAAIMPAVGRPPIWLEQAFVRES